VSKLPTSGGVNHNYTFAAPAMLVPSSDVQTYDLSFPASDPGQPELFARSVYLVMQAMDTIVPIGDQGSKSLQVLANVIGGNIGFLKDIGVINLADNTKKYSLKEFNGIATAIRDDLKSVLRGVWDFNQVPEAKWYPDPALTGKTTGQKINGKEATFNVY